MKCPKKVLGEVIGYSFNLFTLTRHIEKNYLKKDSQLTKSPNLVIIASLQKLKRISTQSFKNDFMLSVKM